MKSVINAATCERDPLLVRVLWATGARISEALALRPMDIRRDHVAQCQAGWSRLQMAYLTVGDEETRQLMQNVPE